MPDRLDLDYADAPADLRRLAGQAVASGRRRKRRRRGASAGGVIALAAVVAVSVAATRGPSRPSQLLQTSPAASASASDTASATPAPTAVAPSVGPAVRAAVGNDLGVSPIPLGPAATEPKTFIGSTGAGDEQQTVYDAKTGSAIRALGAKGQLLSVLSEDRRTLYQPTGVGCKPYDAVDVATGAVTPDPFVTAGSTGAGQPALRDLDAALPSPDGGRVASRSCDATRSTTTIYISQLNSGAQSAAVLPGNLYPESWSPDGSVLALSDRQSTETVELLDTTTMALTAPPAEAPAGGCTFGGVQLTSDTTYLATEDCTANDGSPALPAQTNHVAVLSISASPSGAAHVLGDVTVYADPDGAGQPFSELALDASRTHALVQVSRSPKTLVPADQNGLVFAVASDGVKQLPVADTYQAQW